MIKTDDLNEESSIVEILSKYNYDITISISRDIDNPQIEARRTRQAISEMDSVGLQPSHFTIKYASKDKMRFLIYDSDDTYKSILYKILQEME